MKSQKLDIYQVVAKIEPCIDRIDHILDTVLAAENNKQADLMERYFLLTQAANKLVSAQEQLEAIELEMNKVRAVVQKDLKTASRKTRKAKAK
jgi:hypothetical protein